MLYAILKELPFFMNTQSGSSGASLFGAFDNAAFAENPFPIFEQMRLMGPIVPFDSPFGGPQKGWLVTRLEEAVQILKDNKQFTVEAARVYGSGANRAMEHGAGALQTILGTVLSGLVGWRG